MKNKLIFVAALALILAPSTASASDAAAIIASVICGLVPEVIDLARALAILMFIYGGAKYAYSADDPGGRKQGKMTCIHAIIGGILLMIAMAIADLATNNIAAYCPGM